MKTEDGQGWNDSFLFVQILRNRTYKLELILLIRMLMNFKPVVKDWEQIRIVVLKAPVSNVANNEGAFVHNVEKPKDQEYKRRAFACQ